MLSVLRALRDISDRVAHGEVQVTPDLAEDHVRATTYTVEHLNSLVEREVRRRLARQSGDGWPSPD